MDEEVIPMPEAVVVKQGIVNNADVEDLLMPLSYSGRLGVW